MFKKGEQVMDGQGNLVTFVRTIKEDQHVVVYQNTPPDNTSTITYIVKPVTKNEIQSLTERLKVQSGLYQFHQPSFSTEKEVFKQAIIFLDHLARFINETTEVSADGKSAVAD